MTAVLGNEVRTHRSEISLRSVEDSIRWFEILSQNPEGPNTVSGLHVSGVESFPSLLNWPKLRNLHHLELRGIDFRGSRESLSTPFFDAYGSAINELVLEELRFREEDEFFALIAPFKNLISLIIRDVEWGMGELLCDDDSESDSEDETHKHTIQPGDCCSIANAGSRLTDCKNIDLPLLKHLSLRGCSSTIARHLTRMPSKLRLSRLEISWEDEHLLPLGEMVEACGQSLSELSISGVFNAECDYPISLESCTQLSSLYLNGVHLFPDEPLGSALHHLASTLPRTKDSAHPRAVNVGFLLDVGPAWESCIDRVDWNAAGTPLTSLGSRLKEGKDHWSVTIKVDSSYLAVSEHEERRILGIAQRKLEKFSPVLRLDIC